ncbi:hypothetical protein N7533_012913 [Penicillium manginii]|uniref:uncharacterized protein n=1 Tax=Penicillium manginii TaxID=203109 RepID=UPI002547D3C0|nr:uncharacterized protein N7533_012913 [Penicillium manginii]KAJ5734510.1 hypothetical protein N7533_012913 [Penicillium manginii]
MLTSNRVPDNVEALARSAPCRARQASALGVPPYLKDWLAFSAIIAAKTGRSPQWYASSNFLAFLNTMPIVSGADLESVRW